MVGGKKSKNPFKHPPRLLRPVMGRGINQAPVCLILTTGVGVGPPPHHSYRRRPIRHPHHQEKAKDIEKRMQERGKEVRKYERGGLRLKDISQVGLRVAHGK